MQADAGGRLQELRHETVTNCTPIPHWLEFADPVDAARVALTIAIAPDQFWGAR